MNFNESQTKQNLAKSYAAECQAGARYQFMATQAQLEGLVYVKDTLKMIAKNEMAHAKLFYDYILDKSGQSNIKVCLEADYPYVEPKLQESLESEENIEKEEFDAIYPEFAKVAKKEGFKDIANSFELVAAVEGTHAEMLSKIRCGYENGSIYKNKSKRLFRCSNCGHLAYLTEGWKKCPLCSIEQGYIAIDFNDVFEKCIS